MKTDNKVRGFVPSFYVTIFFLFGNTIMSLEIAETTYITSKGSNLATVDVYGKKSVDKVAVNAGGLAGIAEKLNIPLTGKIFGELDKKIAKMKGKDGVWGLDDIDDVVKEVRNITKDKKLLDNLKQSLVTDTLNKAGLSLNPATIQGIVSGNIDVNKLVFNEFGVKADISKLDTANGITTFLTELTGSSKYAELIKQDETFGVLKNLFDQATKLRIPKIVDKFIEVVNDDKVRRKLLLKSIPKTIDNSDIDTLDKIGNELGYNTIADVHPEAITHLLSKYSTLNGNLPDKEDAVKLKTLLDNITPNWWKTTRNGVEVFSLAPFSNLSGHAKIALSFIPEVAPVVIMSGIYDTRSIEEIMDEKRPWIKLAANNEEG